MYTHPNIGLPQIETDRMSKGEHFTTNGRRSVNYIKGQDNGLDWLKHHTRESDQEWKKVRNLVNDTTFSLRQSSSLGQIGSDRTSKGEHFTTDGGRSGNDDTKDQCDGTDWLKSHLQLQISNVGTKHMMNQNRPLPDITSSHRSSPMYDDSEMTESRSHRKCDMRTYEMTRKIREPTVYPKMSGPCNDSSSSMMHKKCPLPGRTPMHHSVSDIPTISGDNAIANKSRKIREPTVYPQISGPYNDSTSPMLHKKYPFPGTTSRHHFVSDITSISGDNAIANKSRKIREPTIYPKCSEPCNDSSSSMLHKKFTLPGRTSRVKNLDNVNNDPLYSTGLIPHAPFFVTSKRNKDNYSRAAIERQEKKFTEDFLEEVRGGTRHSTVATKALAHLVHSFKVTKTALLQLQRRSNKIGCLADEGLNPRDNSGEIIHNVVEELTNCVDEYVFNRLDLYELNNESMFHKVIFDRAPELPEVYCDGPE